MKQKLIIVGSRSNYAIERHYYKHLSEYFEVIMFDAKGIFSEYYSQSILRKLLFRLELSSIYSSINKQLIDLINNFRPDILLVFKGMEVEPSTLKYAKSKNIFLANYNPDNPFIFSGSGSGNKNVTEAIPLFDLHITYDSAVKASIENKYNIRCELIPFGFEIDDDLYDEVCEQAEVKKLCFVGMPDNFRANFILQMAQEGIQIDVYGLNWSKYVNHKNITIFEPVYDKALYRTLYKYRIQLNYMRPHNIMSHNMRTFEVPAIGGIQLAPHTIDHVTFFGVGKEIFTYTDVHDCIKKVKYILSLTDDEAQKIRQKAKEKSIQAKYSYKDRAEQLFRILNQN